MGCCARRRACLTLTRFDIHIDTPGTGVFHAAGCVLEEDAGVLRRVDFRYTRQFLEHPAAFAFDPRRLPLEPGETRFPCQGGMPGFLDDHLPDAWGRRVLAVFVLEHHARRLNVNSAVELLTVEPAVSRIGALSFATVGREPTFTYGAPLSQLVEVEHAAVRVDASRPTDTEAFGLLQLAQAGSGSGGARPKALLTDGATHYLAKFNRLSGDAYNHARVELACLEMARAGGLDAARGRVAEAADGREVLLLERFDIAPLGGRHHLVTVNALQKEEATQRDSGLLFRYDDIGELLARYSVSIQSDVEQLVRLALFNRAINNTDDHARNFSLIHRGEGYRLSPAYDLVPSVAVGEYHAAGFGFDPSPPRPSEAGRAGRLFGLSRPRLRTCAEEIRNALCGWRQFAERAGVEEAECEMLAARFNA